MKGETSWPGDKYFTYLKTLFTLSKLEKTTDILQNSLLCVISQIDMLEMTEEGIAMLVFRKLSKVLLKSCCLQTCPVGLVFIL